MFVTCFAAGLDWLEGLLPAFFVIFWILSQVFGVIRRAAKPIAPKRPVLLPEGIEDARTIFEREIEKMKQAQQLQRRAAQQVESGSPAEVRRRRPEGQRVNRRGGPRPPVGARESSAAPPLPTTRPQPSPATSPIGGQRVGTGIAKHVEEAFAHDLAHASVSSQGEVAAHQATAPLAAQIAGMLRDPESIRRAILIREVLDRPTDRW